MKHTLPAVIIGISFTTLFSCVLSGIPFISEVPENARQNFSLNFFRHINTKELTDYIVSPAAVQKLLVVLYDGGGDEARLEILDDLCVKIKNVHTFMDIAESVKQQIMREEAHRLYFKNDFKDLKRNLEIKNYIVGTKPFDNAFKITARHYFDVQTVNRMTEVDPYAAVKHEFEEIVDDSANLQILSSIAFEASLKHSFSLAAKRLNGVGKFRYATLENLRIIELPLQTNEELTLQIFLPNMEQCLTDFIAQFGKEMNHMNQYDDKLSLKMVNVTLPELNWQSLTDLGSYFKNHGTAVKRMLTENFAMEYGFDSRTGVKIDNFWLKTKVHITPPAVDDTSKAENMIEKAIVDQNEIPTSVASGNEIETDTESKDLGTEGVLETFDATEKSFIYFIKSKDILYFSGVHYVHNEN